VDFSEKTAEIWEKFKYKNSGNLVKKIDIKSAEIWEKCGNMASYDFSYAEFW
jgi:hypothetical protein